MNKIIRRESIPALTVLRRIKYPPTHLVTVQTGMITAICAVIDLIAFLASVSLVLFRVEALLAYSPMLQPSGLHLVFNLPLSKLYANSLMSSLNSRAGWKYGNSVGNALNAVMTDSNGRPVSMSGHGEDTTGQPPVFGAHMRVSTPRFYQPSLRTPSSDYVHAGYHELPSSSVAASTMLGAHSAHSRCREAGKSSKRSVSM